MTLYRQALTPSPVGGLPAAPVSVIPHGVGAPPPPGLDPKKGKLMCIKVRMLDDTVGVFHLGHRALGQSLFDEVCRHLNLLECDYFGLEFYDCYGNRCWLNHQKPILRQITENRSDARFYFVVKFYSPNPSELEEEYTRYLFALQIKRDLATGNLPCNDNTAALMASYIVQAECGDFVAEDYPDHTYLSVTKFVPNQDAEFEKRVMVSHRKHVGLSPAEADMLLLETARRCEMYGVKLHPAKDHAAVPINLAVIHSGLNVFQGLSCINRFSWAKIRKLNFKRKRLLIKMHPETFGLYKDTVDFTFDTRNECKMFWKKCIEHHTFFRCAEVPKTPHQQFEFFSKGSTFRFSGRTQKQLIEYVREHHKRREPFQRPISSVTSLGMINNNDLRPSFERTFPTPILPIPSSSLLDTKEELIANGTLSPDSRKVQFQDDLALSRVGGGLLPNYSDSLPQVAARPAQPQLSQGAAQNEPIGDGPSTPRLPRRTIAPLQHFSTSDSITSTVESPSPNLTNAKNAIITFHLPYEGEIPVSMLRSSNNNASESSTVMVEHEQPVNYSVSSCSVVGQPAHYVNVHSKSSHVPPPQSYSNVSIVSYSTHPHYVTASTVNHSQAPQVSPYPDVGTAPLDINGIVQPLIANGERQVAANATGRVLSGTQNMEHYRYEPPRTVVENRVPLGNGQSQQHLVLSPEHGAESRLPREQARCTSEPRLVSSVMELVHMERQSPTDGVSEKYVTEMQLTTLKIQAYAEDVVPLNTDAAAAVEPQQHSIAEATTTAGLDNRRRVQLTIPNSSYTSSSTPTTNDDSSLDYLRQDGGTIATTTTVATVCSNPPNHSVTSSPFIPLVPVLQSTGSARTFTSITAVTKPIAELQTYQRSRPAPSVAPKPVVSVQVASQPPPVAPKPNFYCTAAVQHRPHYAEAPSHDIVSSSTVHSTTLPADVNYSVSSQSLRDKQPIPPRQTNEDLSYVLHRYIAENNNEHTRPRLIDQGGGYAATMQCPPQPRVPQFSTFRDVGNVRSVPLNLISDSYSVARASGVYYEHRPDYSDQRSSRPMVRQPTPVDSSYRFRQKSLELVPRKRLPSPGNFSCEDHTISPDSEQNVLSSILRRGSSSSRDIKPSYGKRNDPRRLTQPIMRQKTSATSSGNQTPVGQGPRPILKRLGPNGVRSQPNLPAPLGGDVDISIFYDSGDEDAGSYDVTSLHDSMDALETLEQGEQRATTTEEAESGEFKGSQVSATALMCSSEEFRPKKDPNLMQQENLERGRGERVEDTQYPECEVQAPRDAAVSEEDSQQLQFPAETVLPATTMITTVSISDSASADDEDNVINNNYYNNNDNSVSRDNVGSGVQLPAEAVADRLCSSIFQFHVLP